MHADSTATAGPPPTARSRKTNGSSLFVAGDGRGVWARRWRDLVGLYADDLGGPELLSAFQTGLVETAATLRCELERLEGQLSLGERVDMDQFGRLVGHYRRVCETLGIERRTKTITPTLSEYIASKGKAS